MHFNSEFFFFFFLHHSHFWKREETKQSLRRSYSRNHTWLFPGVYCYSVRNKDGGMKTMSFTIWLKRFSFFFLFLSCLSPVGLNFPFRHRGRQIKQLGFQFPVLKASSLHSCLTYLASTQSPVPSPTAFQLQEGLALVPWGPFIWFFSLPGMFFLPTPPPDP